jgi:UDP-N-acetylglucosamine--N-acetylmuramyl-(pentapeptide) pyrophosphoryl-undecaprenol N-acetylglucosamine transferase
MGDKTGKRIIISGGGTGGHIFPAIAIANALKAQEPSTEILFVGAEGKIEMQKVPAAGYEIKGLPIRGFLRKLSFENFKVLFGLLKSLRISKKIIKEFKPDAAVGVGGYASGAVVHVASKRGVPTLLQEQNSYAGVTNKLLAKRAKKICVAYDGMEKFFDKEKIIKTGNPIRKDLYNNNISKEQALSHFELNSEKKTILILGGSGGARTINQAVINKLNEIKASDIQLIWQTGKYYHEQSLEAVKDYDGNNIKVHAFINKMDMAFAAADIVISRAGAGTISELCLVKKPSILVPSPNVAEDHQTKNAMALVEKDAAIMIKDIEAKEKLIDKAIELANNSELMIKLSKNIAELAMPNSDELIANEVFKLIK